MSVWWNHREYQTENAKSKHKQGIRLRACNLCLGQFHKRSFAAYLLFNDCRIGE
jgi:hypothetical protein